MKWEFLVVASLVFLCACEKPVQVPPQKETAPVSAAAALPINIGDVEAQVHFYCNVPENLAAENITVDRQKTRKYDIGMITIDIYPPYPTSLPVTVSMEKKLPVKEDFVLILRGSLNRDSQPLHPYQLIMTKATANETKVAEVDVLAGVTSPPETMLINAETDAVLLPPDTDVSAIDIAAVQGTVQTQSLLLSNPIRINFHPAKETP